MSDRDYQFLQDLLPPDVKSERFCIIDDMVRYIGLCVAPQYGREDTLKAYTTFKTSVNAALFNFASRYAKLPKNFNANAGDKTISLVIEALREGMRFAGAENICCVHFTKKGIEEAMQSELNARNISWAEAEVPSVEGAFQMAMDNFVRVETGIVYFYAIFKMARPSPYSEFELAGADALRSKLYERRAQFMKNILLFGGLLGGIKGAQAAKMVAREMVYNPGSNISFSTIEYLQPFGRVPGSYLKNYNDQFDADIVKMYETL